jgi:SnoaL-like domain
VSDLDELRIRIGRLEDESEITRLILTYGPAADAGLASFAGALWTEAGIYDWDVSGDPHQGCGGVEAMLRSQGHQELIASGVAHFSGPPLIQVDGDHGKALNYSMVMRRDGDRFYLWRVSAVRWDLERVGSQWRVAKRTNRLLKKAGGGRELFEGTLDELFQMDEQ